MRSPATGEASAPSAGRDHTTGRLPFDIAGWTFDPTSRSLTQGPLTKRLSPRAARLLEVLARTPGEAVRRDSLMDEIWPDVIVGDDSLTQAVAEARRAFGGDGKRLIETISKQGYRLRASGVAKATSPPLGEHAFDLEAYLSCLEARNALVHGGHDMVATYTALTRQAALAAPDFAFVRAEHGIAHCYQWLYQQDDSEESVAALAEAEAALLLSPNLALGLTAKAFAHSILGHADEAVRALGAALRRDPNDAYIHLLGARIMFTFGEYPAAATLAERAAQLKPDCIWCLFFGARAAAAFDGPRSKRLVAECLRRVRARLAIDADDPRAQNLLGPLLAMLGQRDEAVAAIEAQSDRTTTLQVYDAIGFAMIGKAREAIEAVRSLAERGWTHAAWLTAEPAFQSLHGDRGFRATLSHMEQVPAGA